MGPKWNTVGDLALCSSPVVQGGEVEQWRWSGGGGRWRVRSPERGPATGLARPRLQAWLRPRHGRRSLFCAVEASSLIRLMFPFASYLSLLVRVSSYPPPTSVVRILWSRSPNMDSSSSWRSMGAIRLGCDWSVRYPNRWKRNWKNCIFWREPCCLLGLKWCLCFLAAVSCVSMRRRGTTKVRRELGAVRRLPQHLFHSWTFPCHRNPLPRSGHATALK